MRSVLTALTVLSLVASFAGAVPAGAFTADVFPPNSTSVDHDEFPAPSVVGYAGPTKTGAEAAALQTAPPRRYSTVQQPFAPLVLPQARDASLDEFSPIYHMGDASPRFSVPPGAWGLAQATPAAPQGCDITQIFRHGTRYPSSSESVSGFAQKLQAVSSNGTFNASGELDFLNTWTYKLGAEILNPFGRQQCYNLGVAARMGYGHLLNNFTEAGALPVFRTGSGARMVETMQTFAQGFFGQRAEEQYNLEVEIEATGFNTSEAPNAACPKWLNDFGRGSQLQAAFVQNAFNATAARLGASIQGGYTLTPSDVQSMLSLCSYETLSLGYSDFCGLFTKEDYLNFAYTYDILSYGFGPGANTTAALGKAYVEELLSRLTQTPITTRVAPLNYTLDTDPVQFPLNQSIYADGTHDTGIIEYLTALNLTLDASGPPPLDQRPENHTFRSSYIVPYNTELVVQVMSCNASQPQLRFILNDAVLPLNGSIAGCPYNKDGLCSVDTATSGIRKHINTIQFDQVC